MLFHLLAPLKPIFDLPSELLYMLYREVASVFGSFGALFLRTMMVAVVLSAGLMDLAFIAEIDQFPQQDNQGTLIAMGLFINYFAIAHTLAVLRALNHPGHRG